MKVETEENITLTLVVFFGTFAVAVLGTLLYESLKRLLS